MTKFYLPLIACSLYFVSCKTASKSYQKGNYDDAIELGVKKLQKDPYDRETKELVQNAYTYTVSEHENVIKNLSNSKNENRFEKIYYEYVYLQNLYQTIHQYPAVARVINAKDYSSYVETFRDKAADVHIEKAEQWKAQNTKLAYREAYNEYKAAFHLRPDDSELRRLKDSAYDHAITKVLIVPIQYYRGYSYSYSYQVENFQNDILRTLAYNLNNDFVRFYSEWDARSKNIEPEQVMELNLTRVMLGQPNDTRSTREVSKEVVVKETVYKADSVIKQYGTVRAKITTTKRNMVSEGDLYITLRDTKGRMIWSDRFTGQHEWKTEFTTYTGDERALSDSDKNLLNKNEQASPREDVVMQELFRQIQNDLSYRLRNYYSRY